MYIYICRIPSSAYIEHPQKAWWMRMKSHLWDHATVVFYHTWINVSRRAGRLGLIHGPMDAFKSQLVYFGTSNSCLGYNLPLKPCNLSIFPLDDISSFFLDKQHMQRTAMRTVHCRVLGRCFAHVTWSFEISNVFPSPGGVKLCEKTCKKTRRVL